jgi:aspartate racemase
MRITVQKTKRNQVAIPGILGGMGPLAHVAFEQRLIEESVRRGARTDRDHPVWILINASDIPDRTSSLAEQAARCVSSLVRYGNRLSDAGADFMVVPCNTAHAFYGEVRPKVRIPWLHLVDSVSEFISLNLPRVTRVGILATDGTIRSHIYRDSLRRIEREAVEPPLASAVQARVMEAIYHPAWGVKAAGLEGLQLARAALDEAIAWMREHGAEVIVAACTEVSVILQNGPDPELPWIDPLAVLAESVLDAAFEVEGGRAQASGGASCAE